MFKRGLIAMVAACVIGLVGASQAKADPGCRHGHGGYGGFRGHHGHYHGYRYRPYFVRPYYAPPPVYYVPPPVYYGRGTSFYYGTGPWGNRGGLFIGF